MLIYTRYKRLAFKNENKSPLKFQMNFLPSLQYTDEDGVIKLTDFDDVYNSYNGDDAATKEQLETLLEDIIRYHIKNNPKDNGSD